MGRRDGEGGGEQKAEANTRADDAMAADERRSAETADRGDDVVNEPIEGPGAEPSSAVPQIEAAVLFGGRRLVHITHAGQVYTLRVTRNDRLILTK